MKVICGLGNPGAEYEDTRHNVGWWVLDHLQRSWGFGNFKRDGNARISSGRRDSEMITLIKPLTYMNRSGAVLGPLRGRDDFSAARDLLVVVDDVALDVGRFRLRPGGSAGGHNGLKSIQTVLGTQEYPRLRVGVGAAPPGEDLADWVLSPMPKEDEKLVAELLDDVTKSVETWLEAGAEAAMRFNR